MEKLKIVFLGTSQAIPTEHRNHTSILVSYKGENILVDCGEGTQRQIRKAHINPCRITKLLITHWHGDHVLGIPGLLQTLASNNYSEELNVFGPKGTEKFMKEILGIFIPINRIKINVKEINGRFFENEDFILESLPLDHTVNVNGYSFIEKDKMKIEKDKLEKILRNLSINKKDFEKIRDLKKGKNIEFGKSTLKAKELTFLEKGRKICFIFDTYYCKNAIKLAKDANFAIIESTYSEKEKDLANEYKHLTASLAAKIAKEAKAKELILTHISQRYEFHSNILLQEAKKIFPKTKIAEDLMNVEM